MSLLEIKTATITSKGQIVLPKYIRKIEGFKKGTKVAILTYSDRVELRPMNHIILKSATAIASEKSLAKDWLSKEEEEAWKNL